MSKRLAVKLGIVGACTLGALAMESKAFEDNNALRLGAAFGTVTAAVAAGYRILRNPANYGPATNPTASTPTIPATTAPALGPLYT